LTTYCGQREKGGGNAGEVRPQLQQIYFLLATSKGPRAARQGSGRMGKKLPVELNQRGVVEDAFIRTLSVF